MTHSASTHWNLALLAQLRWFARLRWGAGLAVIVGALLEHFWLQWYGGAWSGILAVGAAILAYNLVLNALLRVQSARTVRLGRLVALAWAQILLDLACLTGLTLWTGGTHSPLLGFYVFHMVITSLLLPNRMAYISAAAAAAMLAGGLALAGQWPPEPKGPALLVGWALTLLVSVFLTSHIAQNVRRHRGRLLRQNRRIRAMARQLHTQQQALIQHEKMVAMGQMAAGIAHEVANPLAAMDSMLQLMVHKPERAVPENLAKVRDHIRRITEIVRQLTHFAHPAQTRSEPTSIREIVDHALQMVRLDRRAAHVNVSVEYDESIVQAPVSAPAHALHQALVNMCLNALDAMADQDDPHLDIRASRSGGECLVRVADNGHGIPPEQLPRLFEPFFTTKPPGKGTGLGLAVSDRLIHDHGGRIDVESPGRGAVFTIHLPLFPEASATPKPPSP
ncbi:MAG: ATP-binding protein [Planctomycetota bacterium]|nr:ATP-binding protein [Planctomycetota bacterium]